MSNPLFPNTLDYDALKEQYGEDETQTSKKYTSEESTHLSFSEEPQKKPGLTGSRLRSYAFAVLTRKEYSKAELIEKLCLYAEHREEVVDLVNELSRENYQSDQRVAEIVLSSQKRKGKGPNRIKLALKNKKIDSTLILDEMKEVDWIQQAYQLKVKKYGKEVAKDPNTRAKQIRFLMYRGFEMDAIMKAISRKENDD
jgi:regulatory protein